MNIEAAIMCSMNEVRVILEEACLLKSMNKTRPLTLERNKFSDEFVRSSQKNDYDYTYRIAMKNVDYDFLLADDSFLQFSCHTIRKNGDKPLTELRYAFYQNPREYISFEDFLHTNGYVVEEADEVLYRYYEQERDEAKLNDSVMPIRYDFDYSRYDPKFHPVSHIHFGHNNDIRIATAKLLLPQKFVSFVIRNIYIHSFIKAYSNNKFRDICESAKNKCKPISEDFFNIDTYNFLYLT